MSKCGACDENATHGWQRWATPAEVQQWSADPSKLSVQSHETTAKVQVYACDEHNLDPDFAVLTHGSDCAAPPLCNCQ